MSLNPFNQWPLWHIFTLHVQNVKMITDEIRLSNPGSTPLSFLNADDDVKQAILGSLFYDYMNDNIISGSSLDTSKIVILTSDNFGSQYRTVPASSLVIIKGIASGNTRVIGGEFVPMIGSPSKMALAWNLIISAQKGKPANVMTYLSEQEKIRINALLERPLYSNAAITFIMNSYKKQTYSSTDIESKIVKIRNKLMGPIPENKAINVTSGVLVEGTSGCYNYMELQVSIPSSNDTRVVRFAFRTQLKEDVRQMYVRMLFERFNAKEVEATAVSSEARRVISLTPIIATYKDFTTVFKTNDEFQTYIRNIDQQSRIQTIDTSQVTQVEEIQDDDDYDEDIDEF